MRFVIVAIVAAALCGCASHVKQTSKPGPAVPAPALSGHTAPQRAPIYPGAARKSVSASGRTTTYATKDPFARVYAWYRNALPPGAEKTHSFAPPQTAFFVTGDPGDQQTVELDAAGKATTITIAVRVI